MTNNGTWLCQDCHERKADDDPTPAFIRQGTFEIDGQLFAGVFTADRYSQAGVDITIRALGAQGDVLVLLDSADLAGVNELLRRKEESDEAENA